MPKFDQVIKDAIEKAVKRDGSQAALCKKTGISTSIMSRYLKGNVENINLGTWNLLVGAIGEFLPEHYRFILPATPQSSLDELKNTNPAVYQALMDTDRYRETMDMERTFAESPLYLSSEEKKNTIKSINDKLPYLTQDELNDILGEIIEFIKKRRS